MALLEDLLEGMIPGVVPGVIAGVVVVSVLRPFLGRQRSSGGSAVGNIMRPIAKTAIRAGMGAAATVTTIAAETREQVSDLMAEVREERRMDAEQAAAPTGPTHPEPNPGAVVEPAPVV
jgi:hypothetical protein